MSERPVELHLVEIQKEGPIQVLKVERSILLEVVFLQKFAQDHHADRQKLLGVRIAPDLLVNVLNETTSGPRSAILGPLLAMDWISPSQTVLHPFLEVLPTLEEVSDALGQDSISCEHRLYFGGVLGAVPHTIGRDTSVVEH